MIVLVSVIVLNRIIIIGLMMILALLVILIDHFFNLALIFVFLFEVENLYDLGQIEVELDRFDDKLKERNDQP